MTAPGWTERQPSWRIWALYGILFGLATLLFDRVSDSPDVRIAHGVLTYLLLIIGASRQGGRFLSLVMVLSGFLAVDWFFVPPRRALGGATELNWLILIGFALTGFLITGLFDQLQRAVAIARAQTHAVERLSAERLQLERDAATARVLAEADRLKNALLGSIAHDLRTPIATLSLLADPVTGYAPDQALSRVRDEALRLGDFLSTLQRFAGGGASGLQLGTHDVGALIQTAVRSGAGLLTGREVRIDPVPAPLVARCDFTLCVQVLGNLLQNAARYSPEAAAIEVSCRREGPLVEIVVADRGPGIRAQDVDRLFKPLRRQPAATDEAAAETRMGMGLAIARTFARAQGGDVTGAPREGGGSVFSLHLPLAAAEPAAGPAADPADQAAGDPGP